MVSPKHYFYKFSLMCNVMKLRMFSGSLKKFQSYRELHQFLKMWPLTQNARKSTLGKIYLAIDKRLQAKKLGPNNIYLLVERSAASQHVNTSVMTYDPDLTERSKLHTLQMQVDEYEMDTQKLPEKFNDFQKQMSKTRKESTRTKSELKNIRRYY